MPDDKPKRRLPLAPGMSAVEDDDAERPPWHWSAIGAVAILLAWLPLAYIVNGVLSRVLAGAADPASAPPGVRAAMVALNLAAFAIACFAGGVLVGRYGGQAGKREATGAGFGVAAVAWALTAAIQARSGLLTWSLLLLVLGAIAGGSARAGGALGLRLRKT
jgi:MFS family permease